MGLHGSVFQMKMIDLILGLLAEENYSVLTYICPAQRLLFGRLGMQDSIGMANNGSHVIKK